MSTSKRTRLAATLAAAGLLSVLVFPVTAAAVAAGCLMLVFGLAYRVVAAKLDGPVGTTPISQEALARFPMQLGDWVGEDVPMDEAIARATDTDARRVYLDVARQWRDRAEHTEELERITSARRSSASPSGGWPRESWHCIWPPRCAGRKKWS